MRLVVIAKLHLKRWGCGSAVQTWSVATVTGRTVQCCHREVGRGLHYPMHKPMLHSEDPFAFHSDSSDPELGLESPETSAATPAVNTVGDSNNQNKMEVMGHQHQDVVVTTPKDVAASRPSPILPSTTRMPRKRTRPLRKPTRDHGQQNPQKVQDAWHDSETGSSPRQSKEEGGTHVLSIYAEHYAERYTDYAQWMPALVRRRVGGSPTGCTFRRSRRSPHSFRSCPPSRMRSVRATHGPYQTRTWSSRTLMLTSSALRSLWHQEEGNIGILPQAGEFTGGQGAAILAKGCHGSPLAYVLYQKCVSPFGSQPTKVRAALSLHRKFYGTAELLSNYAVLRAAAAAAHIRPPRVSAAGPGECSVLLVCQDALSADACGGS
eukprot:scaffold2514_cov373-Prasinococcus_capsulatus_cf.AAC.8